MDELIGAIESAAHATVHEYVDPRTGKRGAVALAPKLGLQPGTLSNKTNPLQPHGLTVPESVALQLAANDFRLLHAEASALGHVAYQLPLVMVSDVELLDQYCVFHAAVGAKASALRHALADGRITPAEVAEIRQALEALIRAGLGVLHRVEVLAG
jgi:hypothetical protein